MMTIKILRDESSSYSTVKRWAAELRTGRERVVDYEQPGHPKETTTDENVELVHSLIMCERNFDNNQGP